MLVCHCAVVSDDRIRAAASDAKDLLDIAAATGAGSWCGGCIPHIASILAVHHRQPPSVLIDASTSTDLHGSRRLKQRSQQVALSITADLASGEAQIGGAAPSIAEIARDYRVSTAVADQAARVLLHHGTIRRNAGSLIYDRPDTRTVVEATAIHLLASHATDSDLLQAKELLQPLGAKVRVEDVLLFIMDRSLNIALDYLASGGLSPTDRSRTMSAKMEEISGRQLPNYHVVWAVISLISCHGLSYGDRLGTEQEVSDILKIQRSTLRDVLPVLEYYGLCSRLPGPGAQLAVGLPDPWPVAHIVALVGQRVSTENLVATRRLVEVCAAEQAAARIDSRGRAYLKDYVEDEIRIGKHRKGPNRASHSLHPLIGKLSGSPAIHLFSTVLTLMVFQRQLGDDRWQERMRRAGGNIEEVHSALVAAICDGDARLSAQLMAEHPTQHLSPPGARP